MKARLPLSSLLSFALVAFTVEFDNEAEARIPHRTTEQGTPGGLRKPWLVSLAMYWQFMRFVPERGIAAAELRRASGLSVNHLRMFVTRMGSWWGYVREQDGVIRPTAGGRLALRIWQPLMGEIEERWRARFGEERVGALREALGGIEKELPAEIPESMPLLGYGLFTAEPGVARGWKARTGREEPVPLAALLARVLVALAVEYEAETRVALAVSANVLRVIEDAGTRVRELPERSGVSKEGLAMALGWLTKRGYAVVQAEARGSRIQVVRLTAKGIVAQARCGKVTAEIELRWGTRWGKERMGALRSALERIAGDGTRAGSELWRGLEAPAGNWRAKVRPPETLPHYPMVLHRGGYPDGS